MTDSIHTPCSNQEERRRDKTPAHKINIQSLMASVAESQVVDSTSVWYLSITKSRLTRPTIVTWCCYNSYCLPHVRSHIKFFMFHHDSRVTCCTAQGAVNFPTLTSSRQNEWCWPILIILSKQTKRWICNKVTVKGPTRPEFRCYITLWSDTIVNHNTCFRLLFFWR